MTEHPKSPPRRNRWQRLLREAVGQHDVVGSPPPPEVFFVIDLAARGASPLLSVSGSDRERLALEVARRPRPGHDRLVFARSSDELGRVSPDGYAATVLWELARANYRPVALLSAELARRLLPELCAAGRVIEGGGKELSAGMTLRWGGDAPWRLELEVTDAAGTSFQLEPRLVRRSDSGTDTVTSSRVRAVLLTDLVVIDQTLSPLAPGTRRWLDELGAEPLQLDREELPAFLAALAAAPDAPALRDAHKLGYALTEVLPRPILRFFAPRGKSAMLDGELVFGYGDEREVGADAGLHVLVDHRGRRAARRDHAFERRALSRLAEAGFQVSAREGAVHADRTCPFDVRVAWSRVLDAVEALLADGWRVEVEGKPYRQAQRWELIVHSEQDWFSVEGKAKFEGKDLDLPQLLLAVREGQRWLELDDGSIAVAPLEWLRRWQVLAELADPRDGVLRLHQSQALALEPALSAASAVHVDARFEAAREQLRAFASPRPQREPKSFPGRLRGYQRAALGWLKALDDLGLGACLADDMGLGKTVVTLAWLCSVHQPRPSPRPRTAAKRSAARPSLVVVPKSLLFNWRDEAERFAPELRLLVHHGKQRGDALARWSEFDLILTSYGTLRKDIDDLAALSFDHLILDEAHQLKNALTETHQAVRKLRCRRRLALTGTPVENHLHELWSLLTLLNPAVFEPLQHLRKTFEQKRPSDVALEQTIVRVAKPFVLRRTKADVARDLPDRVEQTLFVQLSQAERERYDGLAKFYRARILQRRELRRHLGPSRHQTSGDAGGREAAEALEALLRLRQAACHPGLLDANLRDTSSSKIDLLLVHLRQLVAAGHKALVFSQFRELLLLVRAQLEKEPIGYSYLDGQTRDREAAVAAFQQDPARPVFLISLKAGGVGLNLTAADYVFLLDPWWNPASEAQAIDRAHRIGQSRHVIAYRLLARGTVEEKVARLQDQKRELVTALFDDATRFSGKLTRDDLEQLLG